MSSTRTGRRGECGWPVSLWGYAWDLNTNEVVRSSVLVNMWNQTKFPAYKSRLWDMSGEQAGNGGVEKRKP